jgi:methylenetetrahydrofolate reductase (NADPH)
MSTSVELLQRYLANPRYEVLPLRGVTEHVQALPEGSTVTVTSSPAKGIEATLDVTAELSRLGYQVVPHLAARSVRDTAHLSALLDRLADLAVPEVFAIAGDSPEPAGEFPDALALLRAMEEIGKRPSRVGITGYPERHPWIPDVATIQAMADKAEHADYIVSQICYDPDTLATWVKAVRSRGIALPIHLGVPGVVDVRKLLRISLKIGLGESMRFIRKQHGVVTKLLSRYTPEELLDDLGTYLIDPAYGIAGWHFFTFNEIGKTRQWIQDKAARLQEVPA